MQELKESEFKELFEDSNISVQGAGTGAFGAGVQEKDFTTKECVIEVDFEVFIPSDYVENMTERLFLYKQLDSLASQEELQNFTITLKDRFGKIPEPTLNLLKSMHLRMYAKKLGLERVSIKKNVLLITFFAGEESPFYESQLFGNIIQYVQDHSSQSRLKEYKSKLSVEFSNISTMESALDLFIHLGQVQM